MDPSSMQLQQRGQADDRHDSGALRQPCTARRSACHTGRCIFDVGRGRCVAAGRARDDRCRRQQRQNPRDCVCRRRQDRRSLTTGAVSARPRSAPPAPDWPRLRAEPSAMPKGDHPPDRFLHRARRHDLPRRRRFADSPIRRFADSPATVTELASIHAPSWPCPPMPSLEVLRRLTRAAPQWVTPGKPKLPPSPPTDPRGGSKAARLRPRWGPSGRTGRATDREGAKL